jgi:hypothetical protein
MDPLEQARQWDERARQAQAKAAQAYSRLITAAEQHTSGQAERIAGFLASTFDGRSFDLQQLRVLDVPLADDAVACIDALRWGRSDLHQLVPDGAARIAAILQRWGLDAQ